MMNKHFLVIRSELEIYSLMNNNSVQEKNICNLLASFSHLSSTYLVLEYMENGDLLQYMKKNKNVYENEKKKYILEIIDAIEYIHNLNILHRDIKLENILINTQKTAKLSDFGSSCILNKRGEKRTTIAGTFQFMSPEMLLKEAYSYSTDAWQLGCVIYELFYCITPFYNSNSSKIKNKIINCEYSLIENESMRDINLIVKQLFTVNQSKRELYLKNIKSHGFFN